MRLCFSPRVAYAPILGTIGRSSVQHMAKKFGDWPAQETTYMYSRQQGGDSELWERIQTDPAKFTQTISWRLYLPPCEGGDRQLLGCKI